MAALTRAAGESPILMFSDDWRFELAIALVGIQLPSESLLNLDAPNGIEEINALVSSAARGYIRMTILVSEGIGEFDLGKLSEAVSVQNAATDQLERATQLKEALCR